MRYWLLAMVMFGLVAPVHAQTPIQTASNQQSILAHRAWASGDRGTAIVEAMRGLPSDPTPEDYDLYRPAFDMLRLATVSRSMTIPITGLVSAYAELDPTSTIMATITEPNAPTDGGPATGESAHFGLSLWDPQTGRHLAQLLPPELMHGRSSDSGPPVFSHDGRWITLTTSATGQTHVFDVASRSSVAVLGPPVDGATGHARFSTDGTQLLRIGGSLGGITLYETESWQPVAEIDTPNCRYVTSLPVSQGPDFYLHVSDFCGEVPAHVVATIGPDGRYTERLTARDSPVLAEDVALMSIDPTLRFVLLTIRDENAVDLTQHVMALDPPPTGQTEWPVLRTQGGFVFTRDGEALIYSDLDEGFFLRPRGLNFDGSVAEADLEDALPFAHNLHRADGRRIDSWGSSTTPRGYAGADIPIGPDLYHWVWDQLPGEVRDAIDQARIAFE